jgi:hypothetical protein
MLSGSPDFMSHSYTTNKKTEYSHGMILVGKRYSGFYKNFLSQQEELTNFAFPHNYNLSDKRQIISV